MRKAIVILSCLLLFGCQNENSALRSSLGKQSSDSYDRALEAKVETEEYSIQEVSHSAEPPSPPIQPLDNSLEKGSKIIKYGSMTFEVTDLEKVKGTVDKLLETADGYYEKEQYNSFGNRISYSLVVRVPNKEFDSLVAELEKGLGDLKNKDISARNVTEEYVDLNIRLDNNLAYLRQYNEILKRARTIKDILEVQERIRGIEEEIESKKGRIKYLDDKIQYSTLNLVINELVSGEISGKPNFGRRMVNAFYSGAQGLLDFLILLINLWPLMIGMVLILYGIRPAIKRFRNRKESINQE